LFSLGKDTLGVKTLLEAGKSKKRN
jgi:hypothetical protein